MPDETPRLGLGTYSPGDEWDHTDTVEALDEHAIERGPIAERPASGTYDDELFHATDQGITWRWDATANDWEYFSGQGSSDQPVPGTSHYEAVSTGNLDIGGKPWHDVTMYGAEGDGSTDDTSALQSAHDAADGESVVYYPAGTYMVTPGRPTIDIPSDTVVLFDKQAKVKLLPHEETHYEIFSVNESENVTFVRVQLDGSRDDNSETTGQWGHAFSLSGASDVTFVETVGENAWGDGIYINSSGVNDYSENISLIRHRSTNNRRQGMSVISVDGLRDFGGVYEYTAGQDPQAGIDFEPNHDYERLSNIVLSGITTRSNESNGIQVHMSNLDALSDPVSITVTDWESIEDTGGVALVASGPVSGSVVFNSSTFTRTTNGSVVYTENYSPEAARVEFNDPYIIDGNTRGGTSTEYDSGFSLNGEETQRVGNIHIDGAIIESTDGTTLPYRPMHFRYAENVSFTDPALIEETENPFRVTPTSNITVADEFGEMVVDADTSYSTHENFGKTHTNTTWTSSRTISLYSEHEELSSMTFYDRRGGYTMTIEPPVDQSIIPLSSTDGQSIQSDEKGAKITLEQRDGDYYITSMVGSWSVV